jgi:hypothetical protein
MKTTKLALAVMLATGLAAAPFAAEAKSHKKHHSSTSQAAPTSQTTTGANMKTTAPDASGQGGSGPGSDHGGSMTKPQNGMGK